MASTGQILTEKGGLPVFSLQDAYEMILQTGRPTLILLVIYMIYIRPSDVSIHHIGNTVLLDMTRL